MLCVFISDAQNTTVGLTGLCLSTGMREGPTARYRSYKSAEICHLSYQLQVSSRAPRSLDPLSLRWDTMGAKISKRYSSYIFHPIWANCFDKQGSHGGIKIINILAICQKLKILWHFEICIYAGPYGAGNFKMLLLLQCWSDLSQTLW